MKKTLEFDRWVKERVRYWKHIMGITTRFVTKADSSLTSTSSVMELSFDERQAVIRYDPELVNRRKSYVEKTIIHEFVHFLHEESDKPLYDYQMNNEAFRSVYEKSGIGIERMCDKIANIVYQLGKE